MSDPVLIAISAIIVLFFVMLVIKRLVSWQMCVICMSVSGVWMIGLVLYMLGMFDHAVVLAVLMGQSVVGVYYAVEKRVSRSLQLFRLPFLLTLTTCVFVVLGVVQDILIVSLFLVVLWMIFWIVYAYRSHPRIRKIVDRIIACCRDW